MIEPRLLGILAGVGGLVLAVGAVLVDYLGMGSTPGVLGDVQWIGVTAGLILFILGLTVYLLVPTSKNA